MKDLSQLLRDEFIGLNIKVVRSVNPSYVNLSGKIIDETKNTFRILCKNNKEKILVKENCIFHISLPDKTVIEVDGKVLIGRPEDRVKKVIRRRW